MADKFKVGDRVQASLTEEDDYIRDRDTGVVRAIDDDGDLWVFWDNPVSAQLDDEGWSIAPSLCAVIERIEYAADPAGNGYVLRNGERMSADEIVAALNSIAGASQ